MKQKVLKALANPARIFYVPYNLAILNFLFWFLVFVISMIVFIVTTGIIPMILPLFFMGCLFLTHTILGFYSKQDQQIAQIIFSWFNIFKKKVPNRLAV